MSKNKPVENAKGKTQDLLKRMVKERSEIKAKGKVAIAPKATEIKGIRIKIKNILNSLNNKNSRKLSKINKTLNLRPLKDGRWNFFD